MQSVQEYIGNQVYTLTNQPQNATLDNYGYDLVDPLGGVMVRRGSSGNPQPFLGGLQGVLVSYTAGYANIPAVVRLAVLTLIQHWWQNTQQGFPIAGQYGPDDGSQMIAGYAVPNFVQEMLSSLGTSRLHLPGIA